VVLKLGIGIEKKYLASFEMWCWSGMQKISCTDHVKNEKVVHRVKEDRNVLHTIK
jgi:hypothetical protein